MVERDETPVVVNLDRQRPYRVRDEDRTAVWVGPGMATVPKWVAEHWKATIVSEGAVAAPTGSASGQTPPADPPVDTTRPPTEGYDRMTVDEVIHWADALADDERDAVVAYEKAHKNRKTILEELE